jgi:hypothetical protein
LVNSARRPGGVGLLYCARSLVQERPQTWCPWLRKRKCTPLKNPRMEGRANQLLNQSRLSFDDSVFVTVVVVIGVTSRLFECIGVRRRDCWPMRKGSPQDYTAEIGCSQQPTQKSRLGEPHECYSLYRIRRSQENYQFLRKDGLRRDRRRRDRLKRYPCFNDHIEFVNVTSSCPPQPPVPSFPPSSPNLGL